MKNKTTRFLIASLIGVALLCVLVFFFLAIHMNRQSTSAINQVSALYMSTMSRQTSDHFESIITLRLDQLERLLATVPGVEVHRDPAVRNDLIEHARALDFNRLAFYRSDGSFEMMYGPEPEVTDPQSFLSSLKNGEKKVCIGTNAQGGAAGRARRPSPDGGTPLRRHSGRAAGELHQ